jgi:lipoprotein-releasing system permease protein
MWRPSDAAVLKRPGMIAGGPLINLRKGEDGQVIEPEGTFTLWASLEVIPIGPGYRSSAEATPSRNIYWIVDGSRTQLFQVDENSVYVPFDVLQKDLQMTPRIYTDADTGKEVIEPARCSEIQIKVKPGTDREALIAAITPMIRAINGRAESELAIAPLVVETWEAQRQQFLAAVEKEKLLMTILFGVISLVAVFLIFCILYMIVVEKTRDIGIIKSVGATSGGVAAIFVGYGFAIGVVGGGAGLVAGYIFLRYINEIHDAIARATGFTMWDPRTYAFDRIPSELDPLTAAIVVTVAILSAVVGAVLPAVRAARLNPVEALRFE